MLLKGAASLFDLNIFFSFCYISEANCIEQIQINQLFCSCSPGQKLVVWPEHFKVRNGGGVIANVSIC